MPRKKRFCEDCGASLPEGSRARYCPTCATDRAADAVKQIQQKQGPVYDKWRDRLRKSLEEKSHEPIP